MPTLSGAKSSGGSVKRGTLCPATQLRRPRVGNGGKRPAMSQAMASPSHCQQQSRAGGERTSRALRAGAASLGSLKTPARPAVGQRARVLLGSGGRPPRALRPTWFVLARGTPPGGTGRGWCADGEFVKLGRAVGAGRALGPTDGLACGWSLPPRDASGRFSAEVACQHGLWLAPAFAAGFKRGWRGESRGDAKRRVGSTDATEFLRCSRGVPLKMHVHHKRVPTVRATFWCASEKGVGLLAAKRSIFGAPGQAWRRSTVGGGGTTDS